MGLLLGFPVLRLRGDYLAIVTLGFGEIVRLVLSTGQSLTGGPQRHHRHPAPHLFGLRFAWPAAPARFHDFFHLTSARGNASTFLYYLILALALLPTGHSAAFAACRSAAPGRPCARMRSPAARLGINPTNTKLSAFAIGAMFAGFAGCFFATRQGFISPESFTFIESAIILAIVVLGGMGSQIGVVLAAVLLVGLPEWFRESQQYRMLAFGCAMVLIMLWRPRGLLASRAADRASAGSEPGAPAGQARRRGRG